MESTLLIDRKANLPVEIIIASDELDHPQIQSLLNLYCHPSTSNKKSITYNETTDVTINFSFAKVTPLKNPHLMKAALIFINLENDQNPH